MQLLTPQILTELLHVKGEACMTLYMPTHRNHPDNLQDPIKFKNLLKQLEESLIKQYSHAECEARLEAFEELASDNDLWNYTLDGLAVFSSKDLFKVVHLPVIVQELVVVADSFHTKPLRKYLQTVDRYQILGLSLQDFHLYEGNRHSVAEIEIGPEIPTTIEEALGKELTEEHLTVASYGGVGSNKGNMMHGQGSRKDELDKDAERFFRSVAKLVHDNFSKNSELPLILAALPEHHNLFHKVSKNPFLLKKGVDVNPTSVSIDELVKRAWEVVEPEYIQRLESFANNYKQANANGLGSDSIEDVAKAVATGRVDTVLLEAGKVIAGKITDTNTGALQTDNLQNPEVDDLLDDIGELVVKMGGQVMVIPPENMPTQSGLAAIFRY